MRPRGGEDDPFQWIIDAIAEAWRAGELRQNGRLAGDAVASRRMRSCARAAGASPAGRASRRFVPGPRMSAGSLWMGRPP
jgi:hypothetical protein